MAALYILIPVAVVLVAVAIWVFFWAVDSGQFDDLDGPAHSILFDDDEPQQPSADAQHSTETQQEKRNGD
ncbi:cbb3-type cytochrome oxidase assembly protein CcoS [Pseudomonas stutzeri]|uniref:Cbb3-type cytochrome oxidase assembly protein CcoS n=1 Tax=Stutzerimonas stutzeri TaxID=316 RepID=A0A2N8RZE4_STUST|nr:cbb3-type cytochrome oxidase assembly protein CcoS [Stutzerimonas stutzeri]MCQ4297590.1 cbb3-type cytochrome oxidase assembly protein CcoS [Stutzerimonas stutzeri]PNF79722.1 cbb3-type cytochrome oxidase assembly protein CcoS [Stutzerimonas stutzeri]